MTEEMDKWILGVDVGGSFTDFVAVARQSQDVRIGKLPSVPYDQASGVRDGLISLGKDVHSHLWQVVHGTTVATNTVLERNGAVTGLLTTRGFRDVLELRRRDRPMDNGGYGLQGSFEPLVPRWRRLEISERIDAQGRVVDPINLTELENLVTYLLRDGVESIAVCFLHSYANPSHEKQLAEHLVKRWPNPYISLSHEILPDIREFERTSTTVLNAYVQPILSKYLSRMDEVLRDVGYERSLLVVKSNGGLLHSEDAEKMPVATVLSGPAAGVVAGIAIGEYTGADNVMTFDLGGTSLDVSVVTEGRIAVKTDTYLEFGIQCGIPMADIHTMGAGGGSIAHLGPDGILQVGPISAGSDPGPACYGRGGTRPTLTDAHIVLGNLGGPGSPGFAGRIQPDKALSAKVIRAEIGDPLGLNVEDAGGAIIAVTDTMMASALRRLSIERGLDPRELTFIAFGGAGPMHAYSMLRELEFKQAIIPRYPGNTSALGCLMGQVRYDWIEPIRRPLPGFHEALQSIGELHNVRGRRYLREAGFDEHQMSIEFVVDVAYHGQSHTIPVHFDGTIDDPDQIQRQFESHYIRRFGRLLHDADLMIVSVRSSAVGQRQDIDLRWFADTASSKPDPVRFQSVHFDGKWRDVPVYARRELPIDWVISGPSIVEQPDSTVLIGDGASTRVDDAGNLIMTLSG